MRGFPRLSARLVADRRAHPGDPERDVLTRLIQGEQSGERLSERELLHNIIFILNAGHETTTNLIGNGLYALLEWPEEKARLIAKPALIRTRGGGVPALRELQPARQPRDHARRSTIGGVAMPAGTFITIGIGAANRDPAEFPDPDRLDVAPRAQPAPGLRLRRRTSAPASTSPASRAASPSAASWRGFPAISLAGEPVRGGRARFRGFLSIPIAVEA